MQFRNKNPLNMSNMWSEFIFLFFFFFKEKMFPRLLSRIILIIFRNPFLFYTIKNYW